MLTLLILIALATQLHLSPVGCQEVRIYTIEAGGGQGRSSQVPQSPCPRIFQYHYGSYGWMGLIGVPPPNTDPSVRSRLPVKLEVNLRVSGSLPSKYFGKLELAESKESVRRKVLRGDSSLGVITYNLHFPRTANVPAVTRIAVNGQPICVGNLNSSPFNGVTTAIALDHTFYPSPDALNSGNVYGQGPNKVPNNNAEVVVAILGEDGGATIIQGPPAVQRPQVIQGPQSVHGPHDVQRPQTVPQWPQTVQGPHPDPRPPTDQSPPFNQRPQVVHQPQTTVAPEKFTTRPAAGQEQFNGCGKPAIANTLVSNGDISTRGLWPWLVAMFKKSEDGVDIKFSCGSTLVSREYVVTAAHCVVEGSEKLVLSPDRVLLYLGKFNLLSWTERGSQPMDVKAVYVHQDYHSVVGDADIALLKMTSKAVYNEYVQPACLWSFRKEQGYEKDYTDINALVGKYGSVSGWGRNELGDRASQEPKLKSVPVVSQEECYTSNKALVQFISNRTLCAGARDGSGPCNGDSGGGLMFNLKDSQNDSRWYLRGIVSISLPSPQNQCDLNNYIVYADAAKFGDWIMGYVAPDARKTVAPNRNNNNSPFEAIPLSSL